MAVSFNARALALAACLITAAATDAAAQVVSGRIVEIGFGRPVPGAVVSLLDTLDANLGTASTDSAGGFSLRAPGPGRYRISLRRGEIYSMRTAFFTLAADQVRRFQLEVPLPPIELPGLEATVERPDGPVMAGFNQRRREGFGTFFTREELKALHTTTRVREVLTTVPGVRVSEHQGFGEYLEINRQSCPPKLLVDGQVWVRPPLEDMDADPMKEFMDMRVGDIEAIELYKGAAQVPALFAGSDAGCGVVAVWLRRGGT